MVIKKNATLSHSLSLSIRHHHHQHPSINPSLHLESVLEVVSGGLSQRDSSWMVVKDERKKGSAVNQHELN